MVASGGPAEAASDGQARDSFRVVDRRGRQRFLASSTKPPVIHSGRTYPAEQRQGPEGTYLIFNDGDGNEKGGIVAASTTSSISLDYANAQAITIAALWQGTRGAAGMRIHGMPDPSLPIEQVPRTPDRIQLLHTTHEGTFLALNDSQGRPRIRLAIDGDDNPSIEVLNAQGQVVSRLPS
ncbi:hypothetical protein GCM10009560_25350 [Nonomuraea longicatena]|uniref:Uncharacterized protein n=1 Tax=Nonomuraea longicatena TaxID=83682 RepID=A0ABP3ZRP5_9ACTN